MGKKQWAVAVTSVLLVTACAENVSMYSAGKPNGNNQSGPGGPSGPVYEIVTDLFNGNDLQQQDFLFVVDDSGSMQEEIDTVKSNLNSFVSTMNSRRVVDWQVAMTTTNARDLKGALVGKVLNDSNSADPIAEFGNMLSSIQIGKGSSGLEMGLEASRLAINNSGSSFMRQGVPLALVYLTDEDDKSCDLNDPDPVKKQACLNYTQDVPCDPLTNPSCPLYSTQSFSDYLKSQSNTVLYFPVVGLQNDVCQSLAQKGLRYLDVLDHFGAGIASSVCVDKIAPAMNAVAELISSRGVCFKLTKTATGSNIDVKIDNQIIPPNASTGYQFNSTTNEICFSGNLIPDGSSQIKISYQTQVSP